MSVPLASSNALAPMLLGCAAALAALYAIPALAGTVAYHFIAPEPESYLGDGRFAHAFVIAYFLQLTLGAALAGSSLATVVWRGSARRPRLRVVAFAGFVTLVFCVGIESVFLAH